MMHPSLGFTYFHTLTFDPVKDGQRGIEDYTDNLQPLIDSIREHGLLVPLTVIDEHKPHCSTCKCVFPDEVRYRVFYGGRRYMALKELLKSSDSRIIQLLNRIPVAVFTEQPNITAPW